jgi:hypothetical protein
MQLVDIFRRDGWLCVWCKRPVIFAPAMKYLLRELRSSGVDGELAYHHAHWTRANAPLLETPSTWWTVGYLRRRIGVSNRMG